MASNTSQKIKVLMFGWEFPPHISGGLGTACYGLTKALSKFEDVEITFIVPTSSELKSTKNFTILGADTISLHDYSSNHAFKKKDGFQVIRIKSNLVPYVSPEEYSNLKRRTEKGTFSPIKTDEDGRVNFTGEYGPNLFDEVNYYATVAEIIAQETEFDVIHAHDWMTFDAGRIAKEISGKPLIVHIHSTDFDRSGGNINQDVYEIEKRGMDAADKVIAVSHHTKNIITKQYHIAAEKVDAIYNAVEPVARETKQKIATHNSSSYKTVTFLGRITSQKGPEFFIEAAVLILKRMKNVRFVMAGSGDLLHQMIELAASKKISDKFHFTGFLKGKEVFDLLEMSHVYLMPSVSEPFGISPLEAMQVDVPAIISQQSGVAEIVTHALKINYWDVEALADAIYGILTYPVLASTMQKNAKKEVANLTWNFTASEVRNLYQNITFLSSIETN